MRDESVLREDRGESFSGSLNVRHSFVLLNAEAAEKRSAELKERSPFSL
jgi:hypothetical protein